MDENTQQPRRPDRPTVVRLAQELTDGDEILEMGGDGDVVAVVLEKSIGPDDNVLLLISVGTAEEVETRARPRETAADFLPAEKVRG